MLLTRAQLEAKEKEMLAPYATFSADAVRVHADPDDDYRTAFQRDRGRIIHSKAFRRLKGKTQVFVAHAGDHYRNRLSHSLEVAQISRDLARNLGLNEDLAECIALAHDLGHTPFGHVGERKLNELVQPFDMTFEHNQQSRRILTDLEKKYPDFRGLNLTNDLLDGLAKHQTPYDRAGESLSQWPSLEAQVVDIADEIAYTNHDIDDGLRAGILQRVDFTGLVLWEEATAEVDPSLPTEAYNHRAVSAIIDRMTRDLLAATEERIAAAGVDSLTAVQQADERLVGFSADFGKDVALLRSFLYKHFYLSEPVSVKSAAGAVVIGEIFQRLIADESRLPPEFAARLADAPLHVVVADFIAGMTDNYAEDFLARLQQ